MGILRADKITGLGGANAIKGSAYLHGGDDSSGSQTMNMKDSSLAIGTNEFCCDFWMYWVDIPSTGVRVVGNINQGDYTTAQSWAYLRFADGTSRLWNGSSWVSTGADNFVAGRWYHISIIRNAGNHQGLYINGSLQSTTVSNTNDLTNDEFDINGRASDGAESGRIFFSNVRLTIGSGASDLGGIVPVGESEVLADTKILCCNSPGNILNESAQGIPITTGRNSTANASVGTASRFTPNSPVGFSTTTDVGSQYGSTFDGFGNFATSTYMVPPGGNTRERNRGRGVISGGRSRSTMEFINIQSQGNSQEFGDSVTGDGIEGFALGSSTRGLFSGPQSPLSNVIEFITFATQSNGTDFGDTTSARRSGAGAGNETRGLFAGGIVESSSPYGGTNITDFVTIATAGNATDFGDLNTANEQAAPNADTTRVVIAGGTIGGGNSVNNIDFFTIATTGNATDFGDMTTTHGAGAGGASSSTRGLIAGGTSPDKNNFIQFITIQTTGNSTDFGDLTSARGYPSGMSNSTRGVFAGGYTPTQVNTIDFVNIATTGNANDFGDLSLGANFVTQATSDCHGGLS